jgi:hypothetical protein
MPHLCQKRSWGSSMKGDWHSGNYPARGRAISMIAPRSSMLSNPKRILWFATVNHVLQNGKFLCLRVSKPRMGPVAGDMPGALTQRLVNRDHRMARNRAANSTHAAIAAELNSN